MKIPRNLSADELIKILHHLGYISTRQKGSHIRLSNLSTNPPHHITIPNHDPIKIGTLNAILTDVASHLHIDKSSIL